jgi:hypothetical protein
MSENKENNKMDIYHANKYLQLGKMFNVQQKRAIHFVVKQLQNELYNLNQQKKEGKRIERTLFGDAYFFIPAKQIDPNNQDSQIRKSLRGLKISIDDNEFIGDFMLSAKREGGYWRLLFPEKTVHFLTEVSKGITPLQTIVYLTAQSKYTVRMYELLMRYRDTGKWYTTPEDLADLFELPTTYRKSFGRLSQTVLEPARRELLKLYRNNQSDIYFSYVDERGGRGNKVKRLIFSVFWREKRKKLEKQEGTDLQFVSDNLKRLMINDTKINKHQKKKNEEFIDRALSKLIETGNVKYFANKLENRILQNTKIEKDKKGALARYILMEDFGVE